MSSTIATGLADYGRLQTTIGSVIGGCFCLLLIVLGISSMKNVQPNKALQEKTRKNGLIMFLIGIVVLGLISLSLYWTYHSKTYAEMQGASDIATSLGGYGQTYGNPYGQPYGQPYGRPSISLSL